MKPIKKDEFTHAGFVSNINGSTITVNLKQDAHCEACSVKSSCGVSESSSKEVKVTNYSESFRINEQVNVILKKALGLKALCWAYIAPFALMFLTLIICSTFVDELKAGILSLMVLIPYYAILYTLKDKLKKTFQVSISKQN